MSNKTIISSEDGRNYNVTWKQNNFIVSPMSDISTERWPFKLPHETEDEFKKRIESLK